MVDFGALLSPACLANQLDTPCAVNAVHVLLGYAAAAAAVAMPTCSWFLLVAGGEALLALLARSSAAATAVK